ncbi:helix-turn-helix transcriptional regulator [Catellatospora sp. NPDC049609]|uniref:helix-turn-helix domain-containing protein n=1 Tax=Catellatospora sp. NPDC049609 TaxID=3155505 RepID=UPI0034319B31
MAGYSGLRQRLGRQPEVFHRALVIHSFASGEVAERGAAGEAASMSPGRDESPLIGHFPVAGLIRAARRRADLSQRDLAKGARLHRSTVGRVEAGELVPSLPVFSRLMGAAGFYLTVVDDLGRVLIPMEDRDDMRDGAERRYPSHLDLILDPEPGEWWADKYGLARPPETFYRDRRRRDAQRRRSQWEVRVKQYRHVPEPPEQW